ncbi:MAG: hypothetical protein Q4A28_06380 [Brachymonas sp.]|nr:hypothetical protein [Brachymonas sp.]
MSKHTPGPFRVDIRSGCAGVKSSDEDSSPGMGHDYPTNLLCYTVRGAKYEDDRWSLPEETIANMHLFAAAPELLEALKVCSAELFAQCADHPRAMQYVEQARAAIAKAEGETNE